MKKIVEYWPIILLVGLSLLITWPIFLPGYFSHQDDLQVMRIFEMRKCLTDFQIPCRWVPDMGYGYGFPLFNYYGVLPYYIGAFLSFLVGFVGAAKLLFFLSLALGGITMYFFSERLFSKLPAFVAGALYLFAPYRALDAYVRGAVAESFALMIVPLVFLFIIRLAKKNSVGNFLGVSLSFGLLLLCHNLMVMIFTPFILLVTIIWIRLEQTTHKIAVWGALMLGFGLSAFFTIPAFFEKNLIHTENLTRFTMNFRANFVSINQLFFDRNWGYGLNGNDISLQIGWPHWWLAIVALVLVVILLVKGKMRTESRRIIYTIIFLLVVFIASAFLTHIRSSFIWEKIPLLSYMQFPWRFLSLTVVSTSLLGGVIIFLLKNKLQYIAAVVVIFLTLIFNWQYFKPEYFYPLMTDKEKLSGANWEEQSKAALMDYLPQTVAIEPKELAPASPLVKSGIAKVLDYTHTSNKFNSSFEVSRLAQIEFPVFDFPEWTIYLNGNRIPHDNKNPGGKISINLDQGNYKIVGELKNTPLRTISNIITLISLLLFILIPVYYRRKWRA